MEKKKLNAEQVDQVTGGAVPLKGNLTDTTDTPDAALPEVGDLKNLHKKPVGAVPLKGKKTKSKKMV